MERENERLKKIQLFEDEFRAKVSKIFKKVPLHIRSISPSLGTPSSNINISFPTENEKIINSDYFLNEKKNLIHFTSLKALYSIINEQSLRLYNLNNSNDPHEYNYAAKNYSIIYKNQGYIQKDINLYFNKLKTNAFILSLTESKELYNDSFWKSYADNGRGVAIEFEIVNKSSEWENFYFTKVKYGGLEKLKKVINNVIKLQAKYPSNTYNLELYPFFGLHKTNNERWRQENEIRILTYNSFIKDYEDSIYWDIRFENNDLIETRYFKLPLYSMNALEANKCQKIPDLKIAKIYFGPNINYPSIFPNSGFNDFKNELWHYIYKYFGKILDYKDLIDINEFTRKNNLRKNKDL